MREFWLPLADWAGRHGLTICLENLWEPDASVQLEVVSAAAHPALKASFDNGHALVFSRVSAGQWFRALGPALAHCHLHDNTGELDEHAAIGSGKEEWPALLQAAGKFSPEAVLVIECDRLEKNAKSLDRLRAFLPTETGDAKEMR
jgi:sugar phosphate isomerase/epimerase